MEKSKKKLDKHNFKSRKYQIMNKKKFLEMSSVNDRSETIFKSIFLLFFSKKVGHCIKTTFFVLSAYKFDKTLVDLS